MTKSKGDTTAVTLETVRWFSFAHDLFKLKDCTLWQAIVLLLAPNEIDSATLDEYIHAIDEVEHEFRDDLIEDHLRQRGLMVKLDDTPGIDQTVRLTQLANDALAQEPDIAQLLSRLDQRRHRAIEGMMLPTLLHSLLFLEIEKQRGGEKTPLAITLIQHTENVDGQARFACGSLSAWKSIDTLKSLGLIDANAKLRHRAIRTDHLEAHQLVIGALVHIMAERFPQCFKQGKHKENINISGIEQLIAQNVIDRDANEFPNARSCNKILDAGEKLLRRTVKMRTPPSLPALD